MPYNPLKDEIFLPIPIKIAQRKDIKNFSKIVYGYLLKCFGKNGLVYPTMKQMADELKVSRQMISKCITELKSKGLIKIQKTGKASRYEFCDVNTVATSDVNTVATSDVNTVATSDVNTVATSPLLKEKEKEKIKESGAAPDIFNNFHPYLDEIMAAIPESIRPEISRVVVNKCLFEKNGDRPYFKFLIDNCMGKDNPAGWLITGMRGYYAAYLKKSGPADLTSDRAAIYESTKLTL